MLKLANVLIGLNQRSTKRFIAGFTIGLVGLWDAPGRGVKRRYNDADMEYIEQCLQQEPRTYNSKQLAQKLERERQVKLSPDRIRRVLKKRGSNGSGQEVVIKINKT